HAALRRRDDPDTGRCSRGRPLRPVLPRLRILLESTGLPAPIGEYDHQGQIGGAERRRNDRRGDETEGERPEDKGTATDARNGTPARGAERRRTRRRGGE